MNANSKIVIIGGGQTAVYAAKEIRLHDKFSNLTIISEENEFAYERPPLSKNYLTDEKKLDDFLFFAPSFYADNKIDYIKNTKIIEVNFEKKILKTLSNQHYKYDKLLIATGSSNKQIDFKLNDQDNILYLRNNLDSEKIKNYLKKYRDILIVGGGFIGLEIASSANKLNKNVYILEMGSQLMGRIIPKNISNLCKNIHEEKGNKIFLNTTIKEIIKNESNYEVRLTNNETITVEVIIVGIGSFANTEIFDEKQIEINNGLITNEYCETSQKHVFAAGDVSNFYHPFFNKNMRLESYQHAQNHGICAGRNLVGLKESYNNIPWMWSDQFDINIQLMGLCDDYDYSVQRGDNIEEGIIDFFIKKNCIIGACGIGKKGKIGKDIKLSTKILEKKILFQDEDLANKDFKLNKILK